MKLLRGGLRHFPFFADGTVATIGNFDGVHLGHQALLKQVKSKAGQLQLPMVTMLFEPQPGEYFKGQQAPARISSLREKLDILSKCGADYVYCLNFNKSLAQMSAEKFAKTYIFSRLRARYLLVGEDFRFGYDRQGDLNLLQELGHQQNCLVEALADFNKANQRVSSTKIREALSMGKLDDATMLLGRTFSLCGRVITGHGRGTKWGIPTANLAMTRLTLPMTGVFCVQVRIASSGRLVNGVANLGRRPTVDGSKNVLEIHLFDFNQNLYGDMLTVYFLNKLRDEIKFESQDALIDQIHKDIATAKDRFACLLSKI